MKERSKIVLLTNKGKSFIADFNKRYEEYERTGIFYSADKNWLAVDSQTVSNNLLHKVIGINIRANKELLEMILKHSEPHIKFKNRKIKFDAFIKDFNKYINER